MNALAQVVGSLLPILLLVLTGLMLVQRGFITHEFRRSMEKFLYWVALPALLLFTLATAPTIGREAAQMALALSVATVAGTLAATLWCWLRGFPGPVAGAYIQSAVRGNLAFVGLPVVVLASGGDPLAGANAALTLAPLVVLYNVIAVTALVVTQHRPSWSLPARVARSIVTNPLIIACAIGLTLPHVPHPLPTWLVKSLGQPLDLLGRTAAPLALVCLGGAMLAYHVGPNLGKALSASFIKLAIAPLVAWLCCRWLGLDGQDLRTVLIFAACPSAVASYVLASQLRGDIGTSAATIVVSTALSFLSLAIVLIID